MFVVPFINLTVFYKLKHLHLAVTFLFSLIAGTAFWNSTHPCSPGCNKHHPHRRGIFWCIWSEPENIWGTILLQILENDSRYLVWWPILHGNFLRVLHNSHLCMLPKTFPHKNLKFCFLFWPLCHIVLGTFSLSLYFLFFEGYLFGPWHNETIVSHTYIFDYASFQIH